MKFLNFLKPRATQPTIESYGQTKTELESGQIQSIMEWLFASLLNAGYSGKSHIIWHNGDELELSLERMLKKTIHCTFAYF